MVTLLAAIALAQPPDLSDVPPFVAPEEVACEVARASREAEKFQLHRIPAGCADLATLVPRDRSDEHDVLQAPTGALSIRSADDFRDRFSCEPPPAVDFATQRLVAWLYLQDASQEVALSRVVRAEDGLVLLFDTGSTCQGRFQLAERRAMLVALPRGEEPIRTALCRREQRCDEAR